jgi:hypothetical protein
MGGPGAWKASERPWTGTQAAALRKGGRTGLESGAHAGAWSVRTIARQTGLSKSRMQRPWSAPQLRATDRPGSGLNLLASSSRPAMANQRGLVTIERSRNPPTKRSVPRRVSTLSGVSMPAARASSICLWRGCCRDWRSD